jgi:peptide/nickel transport system ATP-binding protein
MVAPLLEVKNLRVEFPTRRGTLLALDDINFDIAPGEILGVVGESGAGKSLTGAAIIGLLEPPGRIAGGEILLGGRRIDNLPYEEMRKIRGRQIGAIFQDPLTSLNPLYTIGRQLVETIQTHLPVGAEEARQRAIKLLQETGIPAAEQRIDQYPHQFSGGMRQRVVIALALAAEPKLIVADEPTTALDVSIQAQIISLLKRLCKEHGAAVMLVTHDMGVIAETCDRVAVLYAGRVAEIGPVGEVIHRPSHPYTRGLMGSIPAMDEDRERLLQIDGAMPRLNAIPRGCAFQPALPARSSTAAVQDRPELHGRRRLHAPRAGCTVNKASCLHQHRSTLVEVQRPRWPVTSRDLRRLGPLVEPRRRTQAQALPARRRWRELQHREAAPRWRWWANRAAARAPWRACSWACTAPRAATFAVRRPGHQRRSSTRPSCAPLRRRIQMIFQDPYASLNPRWKVLDIIGEPLREHGLVHGCKRSPAPARGANCCSRWAWPRPTATSTRTSSAGGQRQRISIARALATQPEFLVCDEPTSALDVSVQAQVLNIMKDLQKTQGLTYLFISHNLAVVRHVADRVGVMYLGRLVEVAPKAELFGHPRHPYTRMLLDAIPDINMSGRARTPVQGEVPNPLNPPSGCAFHPRCPHANARCSSERPVLTRFQGIEVACHAVQEGRL